MRLFLTSALALIICTSIGQVGKPFPELPSKTLDNREIIVPTDTQDKLTIVGMAYSKKSEDILKGWYEPMFNKFVLKSGIMDHLYDVNFYFIPMYTGAKKMAYEISMDKMRESNRKDLYPYLLFYKGELEPYVSVLKMEEKELPYLFIIDRDGKVLYRAKGLYSEKKMEGIEAVLDSHPN